MADQLIDKPRINKPVIIVAIAVLIAAVGGWFHWRGRHAPPPEVAASERPVVPAETPEERIEHPVPEVEADAKSAPLPDLSDSDKPVGDALGQATGGAAVEYLVPDSLVRHIVATIDNLPRQKLAVEKRPLAPAVGTFMASGDELHATLDAQNFQRYAPMVGVFRKTDMQRLAAVYLHFYPLFQKAYQDLGYPNGYFNDRLVKVIDVLLATPQITGPIELVRPQVMYVFADPTLEARPAGQKLLIRMGADNAAAVKAKLMELRAIITATPPGR